MQAVQVGMAAALPLDPVPTIGRRPELSAGAGYQLPH
jgi:hypothetical protein